VLVGLGVVVVANLWVGEGALRLPVIAEELKGIGYSGYLGCEDFPQFDSLEEKFKWDAEYLRGLAEVFD